MKINRDCDSRMGKADRGKPSPKQQKSTASKPKKPGKDEVESLPHADELRRLMELAESLPDVRQEKIEAIKKRIAAGVYDVPAKLVAQSIVDLHKKLEKDGK